MQATLRRQAHVPDTILRWLHAAALHGKRRGQRREHTRCRVDALPSTEHEQTPTTLHRLHDARVEIGTRQRSRRAENEHVVIAEVLLCRRHLKHTRVATVDPLLLVVQVHERDVDVGVVAQRARQEAGIPIGARSDEQHAQLALEDFDADLAHVVAFGQLVVERLDDESQAAPARLLELERNLDLLASVILIEMQLAREDGAVAVEQAQLRGAATKTRVLDPDQNAGLAVDVRHR